MDLASNSWTNLVAKRLKYLRLSEGDLTGQFKHDNTYYNKDNSNVFVGRFAEMYMRAALKKACEDLTEKVRFYPIVRSRQTANYFFWLKQSGIQVYTSSNRQQCCELDDLLLIDNLPVIFEATAAKWNGEHGGGCNASKRHCRAIHKFAPKLLDARIKPVQEYFNSSCGYVIIALPDQIHLNSPYFQNFIDRGGLFVPFPFTYDEFRKEAESFKKNHDL